MRRESHIHGSALRVSKDKSAPVARGQNLFRKPTNQSKCHRYQKNHPTELQDPEFQAGNMVGSELSSRYMLLGPRYKNKVTKLHGMDITRSSVDWIVHQKGQNGFPSKDGVCWNDDDDNDGNDCEDGQNDEEFGYTTGQLRSEMALPLDSFIVGARSRRKTPSKGPQQIPSVDMINPELNATEDDDENWWVLDFLTLEDVDEDSGWFIIAGAEDGFTV